MFKETSRERREKERHRKNPNLHTVSGFILKLGMKEVVTISQLMKGLPSWETLHWAYPI